MANSSLSFGRRQPNLIWLLQTSTAAARRKLQRESCLHTFPGAVAQRGRQTERRSRAAQVLSAAIFPERSFRWLPKAVKLSRSRNKTGPRFPACFGKTTVQV